MAEPYSDIRDLVEDSLEMLAQRRAKYPGDDLVAISLLADLCSETNAALHRRVMRARANGASWEQIAGALATTVIEVRLAYEECRTPPP